MRSLSMGLQNDVAHNEHANRRGGPYPTPDNNRHATALHLTLRLNALRRRCKERNCERVARSTCLASYLARGAHS
jgi:hypothetical protein